MQTGEGGTPMRKFNWAKNQNNNKPERTDDTRPVKQNGKKTTRAQCSAFPGPFQKHMPILLPRPHELERNPVPFWGHGYGSTGLQMVRCTQGCMPKASFALKTSIEIISPLNSQDRKTRLRFPPVSVCETGRSMPRGAGAHPGSARLLFC